MAADHETARESQRPGAGQTADKAHAEKEVRGHDQDSEAPRTAVPTKKSDEQEWTRDDGC